MAQLRNSLSPIRHEAYTVDPARYALGKLAVRPLDSAAGMKGRASRLLNAIARSARYSGRERAYICSPTQVTKFVAAFDAGLDGHLGADRAGRLGFTLVGR